MTSKEKIQSADLKTITVLHYPASQLRAIATPIEQVDADLIALAQKMFELMFEFKGVGLAASQVGVTVRMFCASPTFCPEDVHVYINPKIVSVEGSATEEEGCLSFPGIFTKVKRAQRVTITATGLDGNEFTQTVEGLHSRICLHENDHLDGLVLLDKMGAVAKLANRKAIKALEENTLSL
ncbi:MAG: peptide deformylase [Phycisphaerae bacterium]|nr:peptide deformylase [Phycisphaerae bacterium]